MVLTCEWGAFKLKSNKEANVNEESYKTIYFIICVHNMGMQPTPADHFSSSSHEKLNIGFAEKLSRRIEIIPLFLRFQ